MNVTLIAIIKCLFLCYLDVPSAPKNLEAVKADKETVELAWETPSYDGGEPLTGYVIERRDAARNSWMGIASVGAERTVFKATKLFEGTEYFFRVAAENAVGAGEYVELTRPIMAKLPYRKYDKLNSHNYQHLLNNKYIITTKNV